MRLVVDANILFAGLLRDSTTRELLLHAPLDLYAPAWLWDEAERNLPTITGRSQVPEAVLRALLARILERIQAVPESALGPHARTALERCPLSGTKDAPYVACCLAVDADLWSHDRNLTREAGVRVWQTRELVERFQ